MFCFFFYNNSVSDQHTRRVRSGLARVSVNKIKEAKRIITKRTYSFSIYGLGFLRFCFSSDEGGEGDGVLISLSLGALKEPSTS